MGYYFQTKKLCAGYHGHPVVKEAGFGLEKGEILTLIGPNGAGKSTLLKTIAGQIPLLGGEIWLDGVRMEKMSGAERSKKMAVMMTERLRAERMTCTEVAASGRHPYTGWFGFLTEKDKKAVKEAMELVHITELGEQDFNCISDGQRQRVMLARALCQEPEILLLDEPISHLDIRYQLEFLSVLQEMKKKKKLTVVMSLHELEMAERISDKILCIKNGYAERFGAPQEIFRDGYLAELFDIDMENELIFGRDIRNGGVLWQR